MEPWLIGLWLSALIAGVAYWKQSLSRSGMVAAIILGTCLYTIEPFIFILMMAFFLSSSLLSKWVVRFRPLENMIVKKGSRRDFTQVIANGGIPLIFGILYHFNAYDVYLLGVISAFAAANADTWASEIGSLSKTPPRFLFNQKETVMGLSGGVTTLGFVASLFGSLWMVVFAFVMFKELPMTYFGIAFVSGFFGATIDSVIGELWQAKYQSQIHHILTEVRYVGHIENQLVNGYHWLDNNMVNFISILSAAIGSTILIGFF